MPFAKPSLLSVLVPVVALASCGVAREADPVLLALGDQEVRRSEFERHLAAVRAHGGVELSPEVRTGLLDAFLEERVLVLEARSRRLVPRGAGQEAERDAVRQLLAQAVLGRLEVTDAEVMAYCQQHRQRFDAPERVTLRQILVPTSNEARDAVRRVKKDPKSFVLLARTRSRGPEASTGGLMGVFARGELPRELEGAAFSLPEGGTSDVVQSPLGYHVLRVEARTPARAAAAEECLAPARAELARKKADDGVRAFVRDLMSRARVNHEDVEALRKS